MIDDFNPIHLDDGYARHAGFDGVIAHGMLSLAQVTAMLQEWIGEQGFLHQIKVRFLDVVRPGDIITCSGYVSKKDGEGLICEIWAVNNNHVKVLSGVAVVRVNP